MLWFSVIDNATGAAKYFTPDGMDYHVDGDHLYALTMGNAAEQLGVTDFDLQEFKRTLAGLHPTQDRKLTVGAGREGSRAGYEVIFDGPKDLSVLWQFGDSRIPSAMEAAMRETFAYIQADAKTRVRAGGADHDRVTGNMAGFGVLHPFSREENEKVDGHLHYHMLIPNATYDPVEGKWKALQLQAWDQNGEKLDRPRYLAFYHARLAHHVQQLGYETEKTKDAFRVVGLDDAVRDEFSQRTQKVKQKQAEIEERIRIERDNPNYTLSRKQKAKLAAIYREPKKPGKTIDSLVEHWESRITPEQLDSVHRLIDKAKAPVVKLDRSEEAARYALEHLTYRKSDLDQREVVAEALRFDPTAVTPDGIMKALGGKGIIRRDIGGTTRITTQKAADQEKHIVADAVKGRGKFKPLLTRKPAVIPHTPEHERLAQQTGLSIDEVARYASLFDITPTGSQLQATRHALTSPDRIMVWIGKGGAGKSTALKALRSGTDARVKVIASTVGASRDGDLKADFPDINTVSSFLRSDIEQEELRGGLLVVDEISMVGVKDFAALSQSAYKHDYRILVVGDDKQHLSPVRGNVIGLLKDKASLPIAEINEIKRQSGRYLDATKAASQHDVLTALDIIDGLGWVHEGKAEDMIGAAADAYMECLHENSSAVIVSPTHKQGEKIVEAVRERLRAEGKLGEEREFSQLVPLHYTKPQLDEEKKHKQDGIVYQQYDAYAKSGIKLAVGDLVVLTGGGRGADGKELENGSVYRVEGFSDKGIQAVTEDGKTHRLLKNDHAKFRHAYYTTSIGVQSKTRDVTIMPLTADAYGAMGARQFNVDLGRGRHKAVILTDDKKELRYAIQRVEERSHAMDLLVKPRKRVRDRLKKHIAFLGRVMSLHSNKETELSHER